MPVDGINTFAAQNTAASNGYTRTEETKASGGLNYKRADVAATSEDMTMTDFYKLMAAQMQYQDPDNPMDTSELMATMVQSKMITALAQMTSTNMITYATSMLGKEVRMAEVDAQGRGTGEYTKGTITGVSLAGEQPELYIGDKSYKMSQIMDVGDVKLKEDADKDKEPTEGEENDKTGEKDDKTV